jgi:hypothetical protein
MAINVTGLNLNINGNSLMPDNFNDKQCKFLIKGVGQEPKKSVQLPGKITDPISDRFNADFLNHIAAISKDDAVATAAAAAAAPAETLANNGWTSANKTLMDTFLNNSDSSMRNFVVSIQVVLIDAAKAAVAPSDYGANDVAIIQFPLYRSKPETSGAFGGRRRTKMSKRHSTHRTRKHKK